VIFWHFTCDHGRRGIGDTGMLVSASTQVDPDRLHRLPAWRRALMDIIWLTDLDVPDRLALGLTSKMLDCDRTAHRYRATTYKPIRYVSFRRDLPKRLRDELEDASGALPMHWWMAYTPVSVVYDPLPVPALAGGDR
jgi:hypothetical protein